MHTTVYRCDACGTTWESEPNDDMDIRQVREMQLPSLPYKNSSAGVSHIFEICEPCAVRFRKELTR